MSYVLGKAPSEVRSSLDLFHTFIRRETAANYQPVSLILVAFLVIVCLGYFPFVV